VKSFFGKLHTSKAYSNTRILLFFCVLSSNGNKRRACNVKVGGSADRPDRTQLEAGGRTAQGWSTSNSAARSIHHPRGNHDRRQTAGRRHRTAAATAAARKPDGNASRRRDCVHHLSAAWRRSARRQHRAGIRQGVVDRHPRGHRPDHAALR